MDKQASVKRGRPAHATKLLPPARHHDAVRLGVALTLDYLRKDARRWLKLHGLHQDGVSLSFLMEQEVPRAVSKIWKAVEQMYGFWYALRQEPRDADSFERHKHDAFFSSDTVSKRLAKAEDGKGSAVDPLTPKERAQHRMDDTRNYIRRQICEEVLRYLRSEPDSALRKLVSERAHADVSELKQLACSNRLHQHDRDELSSQRSERDRGLARRVKTLKDSGAI